MKFPWTVKKKEETPSDKLLEQIKEVLFPEMELRANEEGAKYHVDHSVDMNLDAVLTDLESGYNDEVSHKTVRKIVERLAKARDLLEASYTIDPEAQYILVDDASEDKEYKVAEEI